MDTLLRVIDTLLRWIGKVIILVLQGVILLGIVFVCALFWSVFDGV